MKKKGDHRHRNSAQHEGVGELLIIHKAKRIPRQISLLPLISPGYPVLSFRLAFLVQDKGHRSYNQPLGEKFDVKKSVIKNRDHGLITQDRGQISLAEMRRACGVDSMR